MNAFDRPNPFDKGMPIIQADARSECLFKTASEIEAERLQKKGMSLDTAQKIGLVQSTGDDGPFVII